MTGLFKKLSAAACLSLMACPISIYAKPQATSKVESLENNHQKHENHEMHLSVFMAFSETDKTVKNTQIKKIEKFGFVLTRNAPSKKGKLFAPHQTIQYRMNIAKVNLLEGDGWLTDLVSEPLKVMVELEGYTFTPGMMKSVTASILPHLPQRGLDGIRVEIEADKVNQKVVAKIIESKKAPVEIVLTSLRGAYTSGNQTSDLDKG